MSEEAIAAVASQMFHVGDDDVAEPAEVPNSPVEAAAPEEAQEPAEFNLDVELPDEVALMLEEDDDPDPDEYQEPDEEPVAETDEYEDPETVKLRRELAKMRKRAEFLEKQNKDKSVKAWRAEAKKYFKLADVDSIDASSKRAFLRQAKAQHERNKPLFEKALEAERKQLRAEAADQWGRPVSGGQITPDHVDNAREVEAARKKGLASVIATMGRQGRI